MYWWTVLASAVRIYKSGGTYLKIDQATEAEMPTHHVTADQTTLSTKLQLRYVTPINRKS
jgi:hypothetical protein